MKMIFYFRNLFRKIFSKNKTDFPGSYIPNRFFMEEINSGPVLLIGDFTGRDYLTIKNKIEKTYLLDIVDNKIAEKKFFINQSIVEPLKFSDGFFKNIIMGEVIEHVWEDKKVLEEINRILSSNGKLLLTVPFFHDYADYHYHIYSPRSINLLLRHSGFIPTRIDYRGLIISIPNEIFALLAILLFPLFKNKSLDIINNIVYSFHKIIRKWQWPNKFFGMYGAYIVAVKSNEKIDPLKIQKKEFSLK